MRVFSVRLRLEVVDRGTVGGGVDNGCGGCHYCSDAF